MYQTVSQNTPTSFQTPGYGSHYNISVWGLWQNSPKVEWRYPPPKSWDPRKEQTAWKPHVRHFCPVETDFFFCRHPLSLTRQPCHPPGCHRSRWAWSIGCGEKTISWKWTTGHGVAWHRWDKDPETPSPQTAVLAQPEEAWLRAGTRPKVPILSSTPNLSAHPPLWTEVVWNEASVHPAAVPMAPAPSVLTRGRPPVVPVVGTMVWQVAVHGGQIVCWSGTCVKDITPIALQLIQWHNMVCTTVVEEGINDIWRCSKSTSGSLLAVCWTPGSR